MKKTGRERAKTTVVYQSQETNAVALLNQISAQRLHLYSNIRLTWTAYKVICRRCRRVQDGRHGPR